MILKNYQKQKQGKQEKSESNLLFNRLCKNLWMIFANVIYGPILSFVPRLKYIYQPNKCWIPSTFSVSAKKRLRNGFQKLTEKL